ncbi:hypothetical protein BVX98_02430 [bacterium F11]|nr:hypothetical protein BVX98_02430 [bacterium F11]
MHLTDLPKEIQRVLLDHWTEKEINDRLGNPEYFFDQVVNPYFSSLRKRGKEAPKVRLQRTPDGEKRVILG